MEKLKTKKSGNTPKMSRKSTKKPNKITKLFSKAFSSQKLSSEKDNKLDDDKITVQSDLPPVNLDDVKETETLAHFNRPKAPTNRRRPARVAARQTTKPSDVPNLNNNSPTTKDFTDAFKTNDHPNNVEENKENINASRKSSLPTNLPPVPSKKTRPRLQSNAKETKKSLEDIREDSINSQGQRLSQKSIERSNSEAILDPPAVPPPNLKPRSKSISHPHDDSLDRNEDFMPRTSIIKEEQEEEEEEEEEKGEYINDESIGVRKLAEEIKSSGKKLTHSQSLCTNDSLKELQKAYKKRSMTLGSEDVAVNSIDENKVHGMLKTKENGTDTDTNNFEMPKIVNRDSASQRLSFQGTEYYKCDERRSSSESKSSWRRDQTVDGSDIPKGEDKSSRTSSELSFGSTLVYAPKEDLITRCNTDMGSNDFVSPRDSSKKDLFDESQMTTTRPPFKESLEHSNRHSHYCCDETHAASLSRIIYQS